MKVWAFILENLQKNIPTTLLYVVDSKGSSPGRKGFMMAVNEAGVFEGTIGGGIMEVKMIELAKSLFQKHSFKGIIKKQFHDKKHAKNQSGLICSGEQTVVGLPLTQLDLPLIDKIINSSTPIFLNFSSDSSLKFSESKEEKLKIISDNKFEVIVQLKPPKVVHIFGAGHVGLALAKQLSILDYKIFQYDDRPNLSTLLKNRYAYSIKTVNYNSINQAITFDKEDIVVIASFSYRSDKLILKQLYQRPFAYIGMMGSDHKIATLKNELVAEGIHSDDLAHIFMPIGLNMYSKTAAEIAVSIAGQIIMETNKKLPTGRNY